MLQLPEERTPDIRKRTTWHTIVLTICFVVLLNCALIWINQWYRTHASMEHAVVTQKWRHLSNSPAYDVLLVGDSSGLNGVDPHLIATATGMTCYNACAFGDMLLVNEAWLLQYLETRRRLPAIVVSIHVHDVWPREETSLRRRLDEFPQGIEPWKHYLPKLEPARLRYRQFVSNTLPLVYQPTGSRNAVANLLFRTLPTDLSTSRFDDLGLGFPLRPDPDLVRKDAANHLAWLGSRSLDSPVLSPINKQAFETIVALLDRHHCKLLVVEGPTCDLLADAPAYQADLARIATELTTLAAGRADFHHVALGRIGFPVSLMQNADHLADSESRRSYSEQVAHAIQEACAR